MLKDEDLFFPGYSRDKCSMRVYLGVVWRSNALSNTYPVGWGNVLCNAILETYTELTHLTHKLLIHTIKGLATQIITSRLPNLDCQLPYTY